MVKENSIKILFYFLHITFLFYESFVYVIMYINVDTTCKHCSKNIKKTTIDIMLMFYADNVYKWRIGMSIVICTQYDT